jgi:hypothetical protein
MSNDLNENDFQFISPFTKGMFFLSHYPNASSLLNELGIDV